MEEWKERLVEEYRQLSDRMDKLQSALASDGFYLKVGKTQYLLMRNQYTGMEVYRKALEYRLNDLNIKI